MNGFIYLIKTKTVNQSYSFFMTWNQAHTLKKGLINFGGLVAQDNWSPGFLLTCSSTSLEEADPNKHPSTEKLYWMTCRQFLRNTNSGSVRLKFAILLTSSCQLLDVLLAKASLSQECPSGHSLQSHCLIIRQHVIMGLWQVTRGSHCTKSWTFLWTFRMLLLVGYQKRNIEEDWQLEIHAATVSMPPKEHPAWNEKLCL